VPLEFVAGGKEEGMKIANLSSCSINRERTLIARRNYKKVSKDIQH
jgi:hypothetical protein